MILKGTQFDTCGRAENGKIVSFIHLKLKFSILISFQMFNRVPIGGQLSVGDVVKVLEKRFPYVEVSSILGADSSYDSNRKVRAPLHHLGGSVVF